MGKRLGDGHAGPEIARPDKHERCDQHHSERISGPPHECCTEPLVRFDEAGLGERRHADGRRDHRCAERRREHQPQDVAHPREPDIEPVVVIGARSREQPRRRNGGKRAPKCDSRRGEPRDALREIGDERAHGDAREEPQSVEHERSHRDAGSGPNERDVRPEEREREPDLGAREVRGGQDQVGDDIAHCDMHRDRLTPLRADAAARPSALPRRSSRRRPLSSRR